MAASEEILAKIPHRPPFLWVDRVVGRTATSIVTEKEIDAALDIFQGHYPSYPLMPGVLLCEAVFQSGALLLAQLQEGEGSLPPGVPMLSRITGAKFKRQVRPGDTVTMEVKLKERLGPAWFMEGKVKVGNQVAVSVSFSCTLVPLDEERATPIF